MMSSWLEFVIHFSSLRCCCKPFACQTTILYCFVIIPICLRPSWVNLLLLVFARWLCPSFLRVCTLRCIVGLHEAMCLLYCVYCVGLLLVYNLFPIWPVLDFGVFVCVFLPSILGIIVAIVVYGFCSCDSWPNDCLHSLHPLHFHLLFQVNSLLTSGIPHILCILLIF